ncbi:MAG: SsrA-binding protein SmpB [Deltaproteobacteria bacterium]|nr:SsrA-binding protein SmpB [Deltaproteobacteria bacterium]
MVCQNRRARHDYEILDTFEAGMALLGSEVKSLRDGGAALVDSYAEVRGGEVFLVGANIAQYAAASYQNHEPRRARKLLLHAREIAKLDAKTREKGLTIVPLAIYFRNGRAKVEIGLARGRRAYDKRERIMKRDLARVED